MLLPSRFFALSAMSSSGDQLLKRAPSTKKKHFTSPFHQGLESALCLFYELGYESLRGFPVGLTLIHIINLIHPADTVKTFHAALKLRLVMTCFNEWVILTHRSESGQIFPSCLLTLLCVREDQTDARFGGFKPRRVWPLFTCWCQHVDASFLNKCLPMVHQQHLMCTPWSKW